MAVNLIDDVNSKFSYSAGLDFAGTCFSLYSHRPAIIHLKRNSIKIHMITLQLLQPHHYIIRN